MSVWAAARLVYGLPLFIAAARLVYGLRPVYSRWRGWFMGCAPFMAVYSRFAAFIRDIC
jgi:predicted naringenin-chalcone synthase